MDRFGTNTVFVASIAHDALTSLDPSDDGDVPCSLRITAVVLVVSVAWGALGKTSTSLSSLLYVFCLCAVALLGRHEQATGTRIADAVYVTVVLCACAASELHATRTSLTEALALYSGARILRIGLWHAHEARSRAHLRYIHVDRVAPVALTMGGLAAVLVAAFSQWRAFDLQDTRRGRSPTAGLWLTSATTQLVCAFIASVAASSQQSRLPDIWRMDDCITADPWDACAPPQAQAARRFAVANSSAAALWTAGLGALLVGLQRVSTPSPADRMDDGVFALACSSVLGTLAVLTCLAQYLSFGGMHAITDYAAAAATVACLLVAVGDTLAGATLFLGAIVADMAMLVVEYGTLSVFGHFTHCANGVLVLLLSAHIVVQAGSRFATSAAHARRSQAALEALSVAGLSLAFLLFLGTSSLYASYDGSRIDDAQYRLGDTPYARTAVAMVMEHWLPALVWCALYDERRREPCVARVHRRCIWLVSAIAPAVIWFAVLQTNGDAVDHAARWYSSSAFVVCGVLTCVLPWGAAFASL